MKGKGQFALVLVTAPDIKTARRLAVAALTPRLVACANLVPKIESHYWWHGRIEQAPEILILFKTTVSHLKKLEQLIIAEHPYDTPEFLVMPIGGGNPRYLNWLATAVSISSADG